MVKIIAEIGINHNGDIELCKKMMRLAKDAGVDYVKIQKRTPELCVPEDQKSKPKDTPWGKMTYLEYKERIEFNEEQIIELFEYFISNHSSWLNGKKDTIVIYSSPYSNIPTSSYFLSKAFYDLLENYLKEKPNNLFKLKWGKINRCQTYTEDYGSLNANQRYQLIKNDTYVFAQKPSENDSLLFIDDPSCPLNSSK